MPEGDFASPVVQQYLVISCILFSMSLRQLLTQTSVILNTNYMSHRFARLTEKTKRQVLACFVEDLTATQAARITGVNRKTANEWYLHFRVSISACKEPSIHSNNAGFKAFNRRRLRKFNGIAKKSRRLFMYESKFRYAHRKNLLQTILSLFKAD